MIKPMKLKGFLRLEKDRSIAFEGSLYDGSSFSITPTQHDIELSEEFLPRKMRVPGWLYVQQESKQGDRVYITLPKPSIQHGHHVLVRELELMPRTATLADFGAKSKPEGVTLPADEKIVKAAEKKKAAKKKAATRKAAKLAKAKNQDFPDE